MMRFLGRMTRAGTSAGLAALCLWSFQASAQAPAPRLDPTPFQKPRLFATVEASDPAAAWTSLSKAAHKAGKTITNEDRESSTIELVLPMAPSGFEDRVILWAGRDFWQNGKFRVYIVFGRFTNLFGENHPGRVLTTAEDERVALAPLKQALQPD
jgi:hypothetical protein